MVKCAEFKNESNEWIEIKFPAVSSSKWQIKITGFTPKKPLLCEIEAYESAGENKQ